MKKLIQNIPIPQINSGGLLGNLFMIRYEPTDHNGLVPATDGDWVKWKDVKHYLEAMRKAERMLRAQEDALRSLGADEPDAESAILTLRSILSNHADDTRDLSRCVERLC